MKQTLSLALTALPLLGFATPAIFAQATDSPSEGQKAKDEFTRSMEDPRNRRIFDALGVDTSRSRQLTAIGNNRQRLEYSLQFNSPHEVDSQQPNQRGLTIANGKQTLGKENLKLGRLGFSEHWLLAYMREALPELDDVLIVDVATGRTRGGPPTTSVERSIVVTGPTAVVESALQLLDEYSERIRIPVELDCRVFLRGAGEQLEALSVEVLDEATFTQRVRLAERRGRLICHEITVATAHQPAQFASAKQLAYIQDFKLETVPGTEGPAVIADPVIGVITEGIAVSLTPLALDPSGEILDIAGTVELVKLQRPLADHELDIGTGHPVTIQLPELSKVRWSSEELSLGRGDTGFQVKNLQFTDWDEDGKALTRTLEILVHAKLVMPRSAGTPHIGQVIGFDPLTRLAFVRPNSSVAMGDVRPHFTFLREGKAVAEGTLVETQPTMLMILVEKGEVRAEDKVRWAGRGR